MLDHGLALKHIICIHVHPHICLNIFFQGVLSSEYLNTLQNSTDQKMNQPTPKSLI